MRVITQQIIRTKMPVLVILLPAMLVSALLLCTTACEVEVQRPAAVREAPEPAPADGPWTVERVEIPLADTGSGQEASLRRNLYIIFDGSGSMNDEPDNGCRGDRSFSSKIDGARWAVREFMSKVPEDVNIGLFAFARGGPREAVPLGTGNREEILRHIDEIQASGGTPLAQSIVFGTDRLVEAYQRQLGYGEFRLVVVTDGKASDIPQAASYAAARGMPIYAIGLCIEADHPLRRYAVAYRAADSFEDLAQGLEETLAELPSYDTLEFEQE